MNDQNTQALAYSSVPKMGVQILSPMQTKEDLSLAYTPGIAHVCKAIQEDEKLLYTHTFARNNLAVISEGSAVLGLGNIGHIASYPVMEGKSMLFRRFGQIDAVPIIIKTQDPDEFIETVCNIADSFAAINLEDIASPNCFVIEKALKDRLTIPLMHDDQHGTSVVVLSALEGALKLFPHQAKETRIVINGAGAAGQATARMIAHAGYKNIVMLDSKGIIHDARTDLDTYKQSIAAWSNPEKITGDLSAALRGAGVFIGVSKGNVLTPEHIHLMQKNPIVIAMANPIPEIMPDVALGAGVGVIATGRSDHANQVNNALAFPGIFRAAIDTRTQITQDMLLAASRAIVSYQEKTLDPTHLLPSILDDGIHGAIAQAVREVCSR